MSLITQSRRLIDKKPWAAHLYVTDNCNLDCTYCNEYDNSVPHPKTSDLKRWMDKIRDLGALRLGYLGGEPLMHPDIIELVRYGKELGFQRLSMSTNGFLLTREMLAGLEDAGLTSMQFSVDRMTPNDVTVKTLKTVKHKLSWFVDSPIAFNVNSVLCNDTYEEVGEVIDTCHAEGVAAHARVIHDDLINDKKHRLYPSSDPLKELIEYQMKLKAQGSPIHTSWNLLDYQLEILNGEMREWKCVAGYKYFFVSAEGKFWLCSQIRTERNIMDMTADDLLAYDEPKDCQKDCGVWCIVDMSMAVNHPTKYLAREAEARLRTNLVKIRSRVTKRVQPSAP
jgi:MoaA/NifB/PqqE/SkfB family radical SAM enzyme